MELPKQKISNKEKFKVKEGEELSNLQKTSEHYIERCNFNKLREQVFSLFALISDEIDYSEYSYVLNPLNTKEAKHQRFRARMRNFNIIRPVIDSFLSEYGKRPKNIHVLQSGKEETKYEEELNKFWKGYFNQKAVNELNKIGVKTHAPVKKQPEPKKAKEEFDLSYTSSRIIEGQNVLEYVIYDQDCDEKYIDLYFNYLVCGRPISFKRVAYNDLDLTVIPPHEVCTSNEPKKRIEDRQFAVRRFKLNAAQILDEYGNEDLSDELVTKLDEFQAEKSSFQFAETDGYLYVTDENLDSYRQRYYNDVSDGFALYHAQFRSFKKVATLFYINKLGEEETLEVEEDYKLDKENGDVNIEYDYKIAIYETLKVVIDGKDYYIYQRELAFDRSEVNNSSACKLSYNGITLTDYFGNVNSLVFFGRNYQIAYNIVKYNEEQAINKFKADTTVIPKGILPNKKGWNVEKSMYYQEANDLLFVDETSDNFNIAIQALKKLPGSDARYIGELKEIAKSIKDEWWDQIGMNRQRFGQSFASDGKATNEQAIFRAALITENYVRIFEKFQEKDYAGLLDLSKVAFIDGIKGKYINTEGREAFLDMNEDNALYHLESDYDVHVKFSKEEEEKLEKIERFLFNYTQNDGDITAAIQAVDFENFEKAKAFIEKKDKARKEAEQKQEEERNKLEKYKTDKEAETKEKDRDIKYYETDMSYKQAIDTELLKQGEKQKEGEAEVDPEREEEKEELEIEERKAKVENLKANTEKVKTEN